MMSRLNNSVSVEAIQTTYRLLRIKKIERSTEATSSI